MSDGSDKRSNAENIEAAIEALLRDDDGIGQIESHLSGFNIFEAIGHTRREERHSDFLAFLLDPSGTHNLGAEFLSRLIEKIIKTCQREERTRTCTKIVPKDFGRCKVEREHHFPDGGRIDVLCVDQRNKFLLAIENKIDSNEHSNQLERYRKNLEAEYHDYNCLLVYLAPKTVDPLNVHWVGVGYNDICSIVKDIIEKYKQELDRAISITLEHYAQMLGRHIVIDNSLVKKADEAYRKHKAAIDFILDRKIKKQVKIKDFVVSRLAEKYPEIKVIRKDNGHINFVPESWKHIEIFETESTEKWAGSDKSFSNRYCLRFEIRNYRQKISMAIVIGPNGCESLRKKILDLCCSEPNIFPKAKQSNKPYITLYEEVLVGKEILAGIATKEVESEYNKKFRQFMEEKFPIITEFLTQKCEMIDKTFAGKK